MSSGRLLLRPLELDGRDFESDGFDDEELLCDPDDERPELDPDLEDELL